jgi:hypothetical protein
VSQTEIWLGAAGLSSGVYVGQSYSQFDSHGVEQESTMEDETAGLPPEMPTVSYSLKHRRTVASPTLNQRVRVRVSDGPPKIPKRSTTFSEDVTEIHRRL